MFRRDSLDDFIAYIEGAQEDYLCASDDGEGLFLLDDAFAPPQELQPDVSRKRSLDDAEFDDTLDAFVEFERISVISICERVYAETAKAINYAANRHPIYGYCSKIYSYPHIIMLLAARASKSRSTIKLNSDTFISLKLMVLNQLNIRLGIIPRLEEGRIALEEKILKQTAGALTLCDVYNKLISCSRVHKLRLGRGYTLWHEFESSAKNAKRCNIGNCSEFAKFNLNAWAEYPDLGKIFLSVSNNDPFSLVAEYFYVTRSGDHAFCVVNRKLDSDPADPTTWGDNVFIIDNWWYPKGNGVIDLSAEVKRYQQTNNACDLIEYIMGGAKNGDLEREDVVVKLGEGHSAKWQQRRQIKELSVNLCDYSDLCEQDHKKRKGNGI